jgi:hypothetical protein
MEKIKKLHTHLLRNAEHAEFGADVLAKITQEMADELGLSALRQAYAAAVAEEWHNLKRTQEYADTGAIRAKWRFRNHRMVYIFMTIRANLYSLDEEKLAAAKQLRFATKQCRKAAKKPYEESMADVSALVRILQDPKNTAQVELLGLTNAVIDLDTANHDFETIYTERGQEMYSRKTEEKQDMLRHKTDAVATPFFETINSLYYANEMVAKDEAVRDKLTVMINHVNTIVLNLRAILSRRKGADRKKKSSQDANKDEEKVRKGKSRRRRGEAKRDQEDHSA